MNKTINTELPLKPPLLESVSDQDFQTLINQSTARTFSKGEVIFSKGDEGEWVILIQSGVVEISVVSLNGRKSIIGLLEQGDMAGEISLLDKQARSADATARTEVSGLVLQSLAMHTLLKKNPDMCLAIIQTLCSRLRNTSDIFETQSLTNAGARLARTLLRIAEKWGSPDQKGLTTITLSLSQTDLGDFSGIARENVNRYVKSWTEANLIRSEKGEIIILDPLELKRIAQI